MLPKTNRLPSHLIKKTLNSPQTLQSQLFVIKASLQNSSLSPRIGFIVSTKTAKLAVTRNKIKRLLRESIKPHLKVLKKNQDLLIIAKPEIKGKTLDQIKETLNSLVKEL